jgi:hypothetical protein
MKDDIHAFFHERHVEQARALFKDEIVDWWWNDAEHSYDGDEMTRAFCRRMCARDPSARLRLA